MDYEMDKEEMDQEEEQFVPLNWDRLASNPDVWEVIKEEMSSKFEAECLMKIITAAKEVGMKDAQIFMPMKEEIVSLFTDSIENNIED